MKNVNETRMKFLEPATILLYYLYLVEDIVDDTSIVRSFSKKENTTEKQHGFNHLIVGIQRGVHNVLSPFVPA